MKIVQDLGEEVFPEPEVAKPETAEVETATVVSQEPSANEPQVESSSAESSPAETQPESEANEAQSSTDNEAGTPSSAPTDKPSPDAAGPKAVTTQERKAMKVPDTVHVQITPENLKDYVGPPVYQKDRMYARPPPPGVSTGLGYLGNGSGAVMTVEAIVSMSWRG